MSYDCYVRCFAYVACVALDGNPALGVRRDDAANGIISYCCCLYMGCSNSL